MTLPTQLLWLDLETTGFSAERDSILEVACFPVPFTTPFAGPKVSVTRVLQFRNWDGVRQEVIDLHSPFGLISECVQSTTSLGDVEEEIIQMLTEASPVGVQPGSVVLTGATVSFDLGFVRLKMRSLMKFLHYRVYDVSSVRNFAYSLGMPEMLPLDPKPHRALPDILASHKLGRDLEHWFRVGGVPR